MPPPPQTVLRRYRVAGNRPLADGVFRLFLEPIAEPIPPFQAGQWVALHLLNVDGSVWAKASYSIANAPSVPGHLELGIKREGEFTKRAQALMVGEEVLLQGPWGVFTLHPEHQRIVMFAGGIGVMPLLSMVRECVARCFQGDVLFFHSNRTCGEAAYREELRHLAETHPNITYVETCTRESHPMRETNGRINAQMLDRYLRDYAIGEFLMCGPDAFMTDIRKLLEKKGVEPNRIRQELFG